MKNAKLLSIHSTSALVHRKRTPSSARQPPFNLFVSSVRLTEQHPLQFFCKPWAAVMLFPPVPWTAPLPCSQVQAESLHAASCFFFLEGPRKEQEQEHPLSEPFRLQQSRSKVRSMMKICNDFSYFPAILLLLIDFCHVASPACAHPHTKCLKDTPLEDAMGQICIRLRGSAGAGQCQDQEGERRGACWPCIMHWLRWCGPGLS